MKRILVMALVSVMALSLTACAGKNDSESSDSKKGESNASRQERENQSGDESDNNEENQKSNQNIPKNENEENKESENSTGDTSEKESSKVSILGSNTEQSELKSETTVMPSDDLFAYQVSIDGTLISVPCSVSELEAIGYSLGESATEIIENNYYAIGYIENSAGNQVSVTIVNNSGSAKTYAECEIERLSLSEYDVEGQTIVFAKGITLGCTEEDIIEAFGKECEREKSDSGEWVVLNYFENEAWGSRVTFRIDSDSGLSSVELKVKE